MGDYGSYMDGTDLSFGGDNTDYSGGYPGISSASDTYGYSDSSGGSGDTSGYNMSSLFGSNGGSSTTGNSTSGSNFNWGSLFGTAAQAGVAGLQSAAQYQAIDAMTKEKELLAEKLYAAHLAEQEKYYQSHGKQLETAIGNYAQFAKPPGSEATSSLKGAPTAFGMNSMMANQRQLQQPQSGLLSYGY